MKETQTHCVIRTPYLAQGATKFAKDPPTRRGVFGVSSYDIARLRRYFAEQDVWKCLRRKTRSEKSEKRKNFPVNDIKIIKKSGALEGECFFFQFTVSRILQKKMI